MSRKVMRLWSLSLFLFVMVWFTWRATDYRTQSFSPTATTPQYSLMASLNVFLDKLSETPHTISGVTEPPSSADDKSESFDRFVMSNTAAPRTLNVYVYEMPSHFTTNLLWLFQNSLEQTENLTSNGSPVHRLIQQHSVDFWLFSDLMAREDERLVKTVRRVSSQAEADVFYIPFFTTIPFFLLSRSQSKLLYKEALNWVTAQPAWQRSGGRDHVLSVHHPWSMKSHRRFLKAAIWMLPDLDSSGNWYKKGEVSLEKDVVMPYVANVQACDTSCLTISSPLRKTLLFFRGRIDRGSGGRIRAKLAAVLRDEKGVVIQEGSCGVEGKAATQLGMRRSLFCLSPAGDTPSSARLFDAIVSGCIPVVVSDELELPFEGMLDYRQVALFVPAAQAVQKGWLVAYLRKKTSQEVAAMQQQLAKYARHFQYATPAQPLGPEDLAWRMVSCMDKSVSFTGALSLSAENLVRYTHLRHQVAGKLQSMRLHIHRSQRLVQGALDLCTCLCTRSNLTHYKHKFSNQ